MNLSTFISSGIFIVEFLLFPVGGWASDSCEIHVAVPSLMKEADPIKVMDWWSKRFVTLQTDTLVRFDAKGSLEPWLAKKWILSADKMSLEIEIRDDVRFSDGSLLTAVDVAASLKRWVNDSASVDRGRLGVVKAIESSESKKVVVRFDYPFFPFISYLATPRSGIVKIIGGNVIGTGPWRFGGSDSKEISFTANYRYFNGPPECAGLKLLHLANDQVIKAVRQGEIDFVEYFSVGTSLTTAGLLEKVGAGAAVFEIPTYDVTNLFFTNRNKKSLALPQRKWIFESIFQAPDLKYNGLTRTACGFLPLGLAVEGGNLCNSEIGKGTVSAKPIRKIDIYGPEDERIELINSVAKRLRAKGAEVVIHASSVKDLYSAHAKGHVVIHMETFTMQIPDPYGVLSMYTTGSNENFSKYSNSAFDQVMAKAVSEFDPRTRYKYYAEAVQTLANDIMMIPLINESRFSIVSNGISGFETQSVGPFYSTYHQLKKQSGVVSGK